MKFPKLFVTFFGGIILILANCLKPEEPQAPRLIAPEDGAVFDSLPPTFVWSSDVNADGYILTVDYDSAGLGETIVGLDHLWINSSDTTYTLTKEDYGYFQNITYFWHVASYWTEGNDTLYNWSEWRSFAIEKPEPQGFDLDTTYFPMGLGYEWTFERKNPIDGFVYDTLKVTVIDSFWMGDSLFFEMDTNWFRDRGTSFSTGKVLVFLTPYKTGGYEYSISVSNPDTFSKGDDDGWERIVFEYDTLVIDVGYNESEYGPDAAWTWTKRLKGIGIVKQVDWFASHNEPGWQTLDSLVLFKTPQGQVWP